MYACFYHSRTNELFLPGLFEGDEFESSLVMARLSPFSLFSLKLELLTVMSDILTASEAQLSVNPIVNK